MRRLICLGVMVSMGLVAACSSDSSNGGKGGAGGAGGAGAAAGTNGHAGAGGQAAGGAAGQAAGGAAGQAAGGAAGQAAGGAAGSATVTCLDPAMFSSFFSISDSTFCAVAIYTAPESLSFQAPTWGSHGGPLVVQPASGTGVTLERWTPPTGSTGAMTVETTPVASAVPTGAYLGSQAVDLPFFGWTAISYTKTDVTGQIEMIAGGAIVATYDANGPYSVAGVPGPSSQGRLLYTGLSPLGMDTTNTNGLYAADACSSPAQALGTGTGCSASTLVAAWGEDSGPVVADSNDDVFAVLTSATSGTQEARGFLASSIARGSAATAGVTLFTLNGYSGSLAALSPTATLPGVVILQSIDGTTNDPLDVIQQKFTTGGSLAVMGTQSTFLRVAPAQALSFVVDGSERIWVAASGTSSTTYVVLARQ